MPSCARAGSRGQEAEGEGEPVFHPRNSCQGSLTGTLGSCWDETTSVTWRRSKSCYLWRPLSANGRQHQLDNNGSAKASERLGLELVLTCQK